MRIGVNAHHAAELEGPLMPTPIQIQTPWVCVDFNCNAVLGARLKDLFDVNVVTRPSKQLPARHVTQDRGARICYSPQDAICLLLSAELKPAVDTRHNEVEARQNLIRIVQRAVHEDVRLDTLQDTEVAGVAFVQPVNFRVLFEDFIER